MTSYLPPPEAERHVVSVLHGLGEIECMRRVPELRLVSLAGLGTEWLAGRGEGHAAGTVGR